MDNNIEKGIAHGASLLADLTKGGAIKKAEKYQAFARKKWKKGEKQDAVFLYAAAAVLLRHVPPNATPEQLEAAVEVVDAEDVVIVEVVDEKEKGYQTDGPDLEKVARFRDFFGNLFTTSSTKSVSDHRMPSFIPILLMAVIGTVIGTMVAGIGLGLVLGGVFARETYTRRTSEFKPAFAYIWGLIFVLPTLGGQFMWFGFSLALHLWVWDSLPWLYSISASEDADDADDKFPHEM